MASYKALINKGIFYGIERAGRYTHHTTPSGSQRVREMYAGEYEKCIEQNRFPSDRFAHLLPLWNRIRHQWHGKGLHCLP